MPRCEICGQYYVVTTLGCPYCTNRGGQVSGGRGENRNGLSVSENIRRLGENLFGHRNVVSGSNSPLPPLPDEAVPSPPPPLPPVPPIRAEARRAGVERTIQNQYFTIYRRTVVLAFEDHLLSQFTQFPWARWSHPNQVEVLVRRSAQQVGSDLPFRLSLRLRVHLLPERYHGGLQQFENDLTPTQEVAIKVAPAVVVMKNGPLSQEWLSYLQGREVYMYGEDTQPTHLPGITRFAPPAAADLVESLAEVLLGLSSQDDVRYEVVQTVEIRDVLPSSEPQRWPPPDPLPDPPLLSVKVKSSEVVRCLAHGGEVRIQEAYQCTSCGGYLCETCVSYFSMCPGSIATNLHPFSPARNYL